MRAFAVLLIASSTLLPISGATAQTLENCANSRLSAGETVNFCQKALQDRDLSPTVRAQVLVTLGVALADLGRHRDAVTNYALAQRTDPTLMPAYTNRARSNEQLGRVEDALVDYAAALSVDPGWHDAWSGRGALYLSQDRPDLALPDLDEAVRTDDEDLLARYNRGVAHLRLGNAASAERDFSDVLSQSPDDPGAYINRGRARSALGNASALEDMNRALALSPEWGWGHFVRARYHDEEGRVEAANADYLRAFELGFSTPWLIGKVREISGN